MSRRLSASTSALNDGSIIEIAQEQLEAIEEQASHLPEMKRAMPRKTQVYETLVQSTSALHELLPSMPLPVVHRNMHSTSPSANMVSGFLPPISSTTVTPEPTMNVPVRTLRKIDGLSHSTSSIPELVALSVSPSPAPSKKSALSRGPSTREEPLLRKMLQKAVDDSNRITAPEQSVPIPTMMSMQKWPSESSLAPTSTMTQRCGAQIITDL
jgi:hypothetical protein